jgi:hypothetical protein
MKKIKETLEKTEGSIKNGKSRETSNIGKQRYRTRTKTAKNTTHEIKTMSNMDTTKNQG